MAFCLNPRNKQHGCYCLSPISIKKAHTKGDVGMANLEWLKSALDSSREVIPSGTNAAKPRRYFFSKPKDQFTKTSAHNTPDNMEKTPKPKSGKLLTGAAQEWITNAKQEAHKNWKKVTTRKPMIRNEKTTTQQNIEGYQTQHAEGAKNSPFHESLEQAEAQSARALELPRNQGHQDLSAKVESPGQHEDPYGQNPFSSNPFSDERGSVTEMLDGSDINSTVNPYPFFENAGQPKGNIPRSEQFNHGHQQIEDSASTVSSDSENTAKAIANTESSSVSQPLGNASNTTEELLEKHQTDQELTPSPPKTEHGVPSSKPGSIDADARNISGDSVDGLKDLPHLQPLESVSIRKPEHINTAGNGISTSIQDESGRVIRQPGEPGGPILRNPSERVTANRRLLSKKAQKTSSYPGSIESLPIQKEALVYDTPVLKKQGRLAFRYVEREAPDGTGLQKVFIPDLSGTKYTPQQYLKNFAEAEKNQTHSPETFKKHQLVQNKLRRTHEYFSAQQAYLKQKKSGKPADIEAAKTTMSEIFRRQEQEIATEEHTLALETQKRKVETGAAKHIENVTAVGEALTGF
jgi:hypothetical protein